jgi:signal transduction histidine kinase
VFRTNTANKDLFRSAVLAALASAASSLAWSFGNGWIPEVWNILLYLLPLAFGMRGVAVALCIGVLPSALAQSEYAGPLRIAGELLAIAAVRQVLPLTPGYLIVLALWGALVLPLSHAFGTAPTTLGAWSEELVFFHCLQDVAFSLVAGAILLNQSVSVLLTNRPRRNRLSEILVHVTALCALATLFTVIATLNRIGVFTSTNLNSANILPAFGLFATLVMVPSLLGYRLSLVAAREFMSVSAASLSSDQALRYSAGIKDSFFNAIENEGDFTSALDSNRNESERNREGLLRGVCALDGDGTVLFMNDHFRALTDIVIPGVEGYGLSNIAPDSELVQHVVTLFCSADPNREMVEELRIMGKDGRSRFLEISVRPHLAEESDSTVTGSKKVSPRVITLRDITERRTIDHAILNEKRLESLQAFARGASESISELLQSISERARQLAPDASTDHTQVRESIVRDASHGQSISNQLHELSVSFYPAQRSKVDLAVMIHDRVPLLQRIPSKDTPLLLDISPGQMPVEVNTPLVAHAVSQLIMNASEAYGSNQGTISLQVAEEEIDEALSNIHPGTRPGRFARLRVMDYGPGMSPDVLTHAADPNFSTKDGASHKGLGLSSVFAIMREHEGFMTIESKVGRGTCVSLYFPIVKAAGETTQGTTSTEDPSEKSPAVSTTSEDNQA